MALHSGAGESYPLLRILFRAWQATPSAKDISQSDLDRVTPLLLSTGAAALAWHRISNLAVSDSPAGRELHEAYRLHSIQAALHEHRLKDIFSRLRAGGVEPLLQKGWAMARLYPEPGLRPYGDIDLWVRPADADKALEVHYAGKADPYCVELHSSFYRQYGRTVEDVLQRSELVSLEGVDIRVPCPEDHLRYLCLHFLAHGAWRPIWLCDIAIMVESRSPDFDWERCLGSTQKYADWVACTIGLANQLLGAEISHTPVADRARHLPAWLAPAILRQWETGVGMSHADVGVGAVQTSGLRPARLLRAVREHWRNPIQASVEMDADFDERPRGPMQFKAGFKRLPNFTRDLMRSFKTET